MLLAIDFDSGSWDSVVRTAFFVLGVFLLGFTALSLLRTMVIPRATPSLLSAAVTRATNIAFWGVARLRRTFTGRDRVLAWNGSIILFTTLATWLALFVLAYAFMLYGISNYSFLTTVVAAGSSVFTLGLVGSPTLQQTYVEFLAAATGPVVIALLIGFLPTMYSAYTKRETQVSLFGGLAGEPAWGPEFLIRTHLLNSTSDRAATYQVWTEWAAAVRLTQTLYPQLNRLRSPIAQRHWLISLLAVLDAAALESSFSSTGPRIEALGLIEEGSLTINSLLSVEWQQRDQRKLRRTSRRALKGATSAAVGDRIVQELHSIPAGPDGVAAVRAAINRDIVDTGLGASGGDILKGESTPITLPRSEFDRVITMLKSIDFPMATDPDVAWNYFSMTRT